MEQVDLRRYEASGVLGSGADYEVRSAVDQETGQQVVLKRPMPQMISRRMHGGTETRTDLTLQEAERYVEENDKARTAFYQRFFGVHPQDARCYHMVLNTELMGEEKAADMVIAALESLGPPV